MSANTRKKVSSDTVKRIFIVDDHPIVRNGLSLLIAQEDDLEVCGEAGDSVDAIEKISKLKPDVALVDISLDGSNGIDLTRALKLRVPKTAVLMLSMHDESLYAERSMRAGARGYLMKQESPETVIEAIRQVLAGELYLSDPVKSLLLKEMLDGTSSDTRLSGGVQSLSDRELEIFHLLGTGLSTRDVAASLGLSVKTVETHREHIKRKLGVKTATELLHRAIRWAENGGNGEDAGS